MTDQPGKARDDEPRSAELPPEPAPLSETSQPHAHQAGPAMDPLQQVPPNQQYQGYYPGYGYYPASYPAHYPGAYPHDYKPRQTNGLALASIITSSTSLFMCPPVGLGGIIMGHMARRQMAKDGSEGAGMALAGIIVGWIGFGLTMLAVLVVVAASLLAA